jgi:hypothetical protein
MRFVLFTAWVVPLAAVAGLLYYEFLIPAAPLPETNTAMRTRMCREHVDLAKSEPANEIARTAVRECLDAGYITQADGITAID